jgi:hypothetical protein
MVDRSQRFEHAFLKKVAGFRPRPEHAVSAGQDVAEVLDGPVEPLI